MIEKIMKAVKSGNKKRGRNITIGAVVGMLLSCTAVMGADNYLWIKEDNGVIEYNTAITTDASGTDGNWNEANPYNQNEWNGNTYINNAVLSSSEDNETSGWGTCYALKLSGDLNGKNFTNNGSITADSASSYFNYGIYNEGTIGVLTNDGLIAATLLENGSSSYGIYNEGTIGSLINNGSIISRLSGINVYACSIGTLINNGSITSKSGYGINVSSNAKITTLTNTGLVAGKQGILVLDTKTSEKRTLTNTGLIAGKDGGGIDVRPKLSNLTNTGVIIGTGKDYEAIGIINYGDNIETLKNIGLITGINTENYEGNGIHIHNNITALINNGLITGITRGSGESYGIAHKSQLVSNLINNGLIRGITTGSGNGYGVYTSAGIITLTNTGAIYGITNAIKINSTIIDSLNNYGILATKGNSIKDGTITTEKNYGLYIERMTGVVTAGSGGKETIKVGDLERDMTIKNATIIADGTSTTSLSFSGTPNEFDNSILNGKNDTLKVSGTGHEILGSIINAYGTAIVFDTTGGELTLSGTIVNGSVEEISNSIIGSDSEDTLILQSGEITYKNTTTGTENTVINGNIDMKAGADTLTIGSGTVINGNVDMGDGADILNFVNGAQTNGTIDGGSGDDTLNFEKALSARTVSSNDNEIRILHSISGFENMNINTNVTLFEKTIKDDDATSTDLEVTGANEIKINAGGVLTLRLDTTRLSDSKIVGHALYGNNGVIASADGGKLMLALNGAGNKSVVSFGDTALDGSLVTAYETKDKGKITFATTSLFHEVKRIAGKNNEVIILSLPNLPTEIAYEKLNEIYHSILSVDELRNFSVDDNEKLTLFLDYLNNIYAGNPYSYSSELSRKSAGMFRDIVTENIFRPETNKWMIYGGLTHVDGGTKDTYYGKGYYTYDIGSNDMDADTKITGAYMLGEYGISDTLTSGVVIGGNKLKSDLSNGSKVDGSAMYLGAYAKKYVGNLKVTAGAGFQYGDYDADRLAVNKVASDETKAVMKYSDNYNDITYDIYLNGRYSHQVGDNLFLEPYATLSYTYIDQDGANEGSKTLAIETDSKSFDYTVGKVGVDLKKVIPHEKGKSTLSAGVSYTRIFDGAEEEYITGRFKDGSNFDILVAHKNEHSIGLNAKYALELENGVIFDVKGTYSVERDSNNNSGKNKTKGEWIVGAGLGYKF
ncbi:hypothetical protein F350042L8_04740 [Fusobacterium ulcerans]|uniref:autotransporter domain-containing protein n=1 Tax=Fusobacterium ulcerans TaxID=861 RepID=UPI0034B77BA1